MLVLLEAPCDFCLRYMSVMFTPSFILIPAREIINGKEIGLITGWFAASQIAALIFPILLHKAIRWVVAKTRYHLIQRKDRRLEKSRRAEEQRRASVATLVAVMSNINPLPPTKADTQISFSDLEAGNRNAPKLVGGEKMGSIATGLSGMTAIATAPLTVSIAPVTPVTESRGKVEGRQDAQRQLEHVQLETARQQGDPYAMVQLGEGEEFDPRQRNSEDGPGAETLVMPTLAPPTPTRSSHDEDAIKPARLSTSSKDNGIRRPSKADSELTVSNDEDPEKAKATPTPPAAEQAGEEMDAIDSLIQRLWAFIPWLVFTLILIAGIPLFYILDISLPLFLGVNLLTFLASITLVPAKIRRYAHPILTTSVATVFVLWAIGAVRGWSLRRTLESYSVDAKYTVLWSLQGYNGPVIGAGDVLFSTLDAGIVSLAIPMYRYRWDLWFHLVDMLVVLFPCSLLSLFVWPTLAGAIGIAPERALAFASRFMSTPLAIELSLTIGADESITVVLVVITGILISIFKDPFFRLFGLNPDLDGPTDNSKSNNDREKGEEKQNANQDYLTIGIAMGSTAGAIGASSLISKPRCMAIASLSFVLFGAILLIFAAIPPIVDTLRTLAGAPLEFVPAS
ncbi:hypothetical protein NDA16_002507 [Ustilago loliicola]|nr:hypothetical protein NDA16_002507 [Ustilago loliicola]